LLKCILGVSRLRLETPAVSQQLFAIPPDDHLKCGRVSVTSQSYQPAVRLGLKEPQGQSEGAHREYQDAGTGLGLPRDGDRRLRRHMSRRPIIVPFGLPAYEPSSTFFQTLPEPEIRSSASRTTVPRATLAAVQLIAASSCWSSLASF
jgi:hypothetical protein